MVSGPLRDIRVLDLTHVWAGPLAVRFLADLGAQVVKIEAPMGRGPQTYPVAPIGGFLGGDGDAEPWNRNALFNKLHRNRKSVCIDLKQDAGRDAFLQLVAVADVVIENFSAGAMRELNLGFEALQQANSKIVYVAMSGFGANGLSSDRVAFGPTVESMSGLTTVLGYGAEQPRNSAIALMDPALATNAAAAVVHALRQRRQTQQGVHVDLSLYESAVSHMGPWLAGRQLGEPADVFANAHPQIAPHGVYPCSGWDQWLALACEDDQQWHALAHLIPALDASLDLAQRQQRATYINQAITEWTAQFDKFSAAERLQQAGICAGPVNHTPDMMADEHVQARNFFVKYEAFETPMPGNPIMMQGLNTSEWTACPKLGAHNSEVFQNWAGMEPEEIAVLAQRGVICDKPPN